MVMRYLGGINSPSYNPLAANVTTGVTTVQQGGIYTSSSASQNIPTGQWLDDPFFNQTTLLLQADGTVNGAQNNTFLDSSTNNFTVTRNGNATQGSFSPFSEPDGYWSVFNTNNSTGYLGVAGNTNLAFSTGDFTIELFVYLNALPNPNSMLYDARPASTDGAYPCLFVAVTTNVLTYYVSTAARITGTTALVTGQWYHVVVSRVSGNTRMFLNGVQQGATYADTTTYLNGASRPLIGNNGLNLNGYVFGYISNVRVLKGTGTTAPTVPTAPLTVITNTQLLTCQSNRIVDNSANAYVITKNGDAATRPFSAFNNNVPQFNGPTGFPAAGGSAYFDGTGDFLTVADNAALELEGNNFCIEMLIYTTAVATDAILITKRASSTGFAPILIYRNSAVIRVSLSSNGSSWDIANAVSIGTVATNNWYHISVYRVGTAIYGSLNGTITTINGSTSASLVNNANPYYIGSDSNLSPYVGYISNLRIVNGSSVYTSSSAPVPTEPLLPIVNTQLLLSGTNSGISDATRSTAFETVGNAQVSTAIKKYGSGSMFFDGTGDWLLAPDSPDINFGTGDFTVECWLNISNTTTTRHLIGKGTATTGWAIYFNAQPTLLIFEYGGSITYSSNYNLITDQWYHIAVVRSGTGIGNIKMFINGFLIFESATAITTDLTTTSNMYVGASRTATNSMFGYVDDLRITKGVARYTSTFNPPTVALPRQG